MSVYGLPRNSSPIQTLTYLVLQTPLCSAAQNWDLEIVGLLGWDDRFVNTVAVTIHDQNLHYDFCDIANEMPMWSSGWQPGDRRI